MSKMQSHIDPISTEPRMQIDLTPDEINLLIAGLLDSHYEGQVDEEECVALIKRLDALLGQGPIEKLRNAGRLLAMSDAERQSTLSAARKVGLLRPATYDK